MTALSYLQCKRQSWTRQGYARARAVTHDWTTESVASGKHGCLELLLVQFAVAEVYAGMQPHIQSTCQYCGLARTSDCGFNMQTQYIVSPS
jgi:hypothetical protein